MKKVVIVLGIIFFGLISAKEVNSQPIQGLIFNLEKLSTENFYYGKIQDSLYYIKFNKVQESYAEGFYFIVDNNSVFADKKPFQITKKRKSYIVNFENKTVQLKLDFLILENKIIGKYGINDKFLKIFRNFKWSKYLEFKMYIPQELNKYPARYMHKVFDNVIVETDVKYGNAKGYWDSYPLENESYFEILQKGVMSSITKKNLDLKMDIYMPKGDTVTKRPLIMLMHGGGFYIGDKKTEALVKWCNYFASMGYVTASVNYRLGFKPVGPSIQRAAYRGLLDAHAAMRFLVSKADDYNINTEMIFVGGTSAGGVTALNLTYLRNKNRPEATKKSFLYDDQGNIEESGNSLNNKFNIKAVINMWGAVNDLEILKNSDASIISFHGDADKVVPIDYDFPFQDIKGNFSSVVLEKMYGSLKIHIEAKKLGVREELHIIESAGHSPHVDVNDNLNEIFDFISVEVRDFLYDEMYPVKCEIVTKPATPFNRAMPVYETTCTDYNNLQWAIEGGIITGKKNNAVRVIWFDNAGKHKLMLSGCYRDGTGFYNEYEF